MRLTARPSMSSWSRPAAYSIEAMARQARPRTHRQRSWLLSMASPRDGQTSGIAIGRSSPVRRWTTGASTLPGITSQAL